MTNNTVQQGRSRAIAFILFLVAAGQAFAHLTRLSTHSISKTERVVLLSERRKEDPNDSWSYLDKLQVRLETLRSSKWKAKSSVRFHPDALIDRAEAIVKDIDRDGRLEVAVTFDSEMAVRTETTISVLRINAHRLRKLGSFVGMYGGRIGDFNKDGFLEIETRNQAGDESSFTLRYWPTFRALTGDHFHIVNSKFPDEYNDIKKRILDELVRRPYADDLWVYYGLCVRYTKSKDQPRTAYLLVVKLAGDWLKKHPNTSSEASDNTIQLCLADLRSAAKMNAPFPTVSSLK